MRILFITATRIGDAVLSTGLLAHLLETYPAARFTVACGPAASGIFAHMPRLERLIPVEKQRFDRHWLGLWWQVGRTVWDLVVDLRGSLLAFALPARRRVVMRGGRREGHRLTHLAAALNVSPPPKPVVWTSKPDRALAARLIPDGTPVIGLGPTANWSGKIWPADRFVALFRELAVGELATARAAVFAGPGTMEAAAAAPVLAGLSAPVDLAGQLSLSEAAACLARCRIFIGNDSGLMHLAAAAGTPTLGLFGPSSASQYSPMGDATATAIADGPEGQSPIERLTVADALAAARMLLEQSA